MKRLDLSNPLIFVSVLFVVAMMLYPMMAHATGTPAPTPQPQVQNQAQQQAMQQSQALDMSLMNNPAQSYRGGESYALAAPASAAPLPPGLCPKGDSESYSIVWGLVSWAKSTNRTEMECLDKVLAMMRDTAPKPVEVRYVSIMPPPVAKEPATNPEAAAHETQTKPACTVAPAPKKPVAPKKHVKKPCEKS